MNAIKMSDSELRDVYKDIQRELVKRELIVVFKSKLANGDEDEYIDLPGLCRLVEESDDALEYFVDYISCRLDKNPWDSVEDWWLVRDAVADAINE